MKRKSIIVGIIGVVLVLIGGGIANTSRQKTYITS